MRRTSPLPGPTAIELSEFRQDRSADFSPLPAVLGAPERGGLKSALLNSMPGLGPLPARAPWGERVANPVSWWWYQEAPRSARLAEPTLLFAAKTGISNRMPIQGTSAAAGLWLFWLALNAAGADPRENFRSWEVYGGDPAGRKYSALDQISRTNVHPLRPVWIYHCDDMRLQP